MFVCTTNIRAIILLAPEGCPPGFKKVGGICTGQNIIILILFLLVSNSSTVRNYHQYNCHMYLCLVDINECLEQTDDCVRVGMTGCRNTDGGYDCLCMTGLELEQDGTTCTGQPSYTTVRKYIISVKR